MGGVAGTSMRGRRPSLAAGFSAPAPATEAVRLPDWADPPRAPWWRRFGVWFPLLVYAVTRAVDVGYFSLMQRHQIAMTSENGIARVLYPTTAAPGYFPVTANWDGQWYHEIADLGYPVPLPTGPDGAVQQNPWAFYPVFPMLTRALMWLTRGDFYVVGSTVSLVVGAVAVVLMFRLVDQAVGRWSAIAATVLVSSYVAAPVLQTSYTESCALLAVVLVLTALRSRRYGWALAALVLLALTRNIVLAMAPAILAHGAVRWAHRDRAAFPVLERAWVALLTAASLGLTWLWPTICGLITGDGQGYARTMAAWRVQASEIKLHTWIDYVYYDYGYGGWVVAGALVAAYASFMLTPHAQRWGPELWGWAGAYPAYQVLVTGIGPSRIRYFLLAFPVAILLGWLADRAPWRRWRAGLLTVAGAGGVALQGWWIWNYWIILGVTGDIQFP